MNNKPMSEEHESISKHSENNQRHFNTLTEMYDYYNILPIICRGGAYIMDLESGHPTEINSPATMKRMLKLMTRQSICDEEFDFWNILTVCDIIHEPNMELLIPRGPGGVRINTWVYPELSKLSKYAETKKEI